MKRTVFAKILVNDEINNGQVLDTLEKQALEMAHCDLEEAICAEADSDSRHERYINYLINWAIAKILEDTKLSTMTIAK